ncbi:MAG: YdcF family protein [Chloroflexi bacterium]|nr:YdcF family protein [Chloroflexota bacterium]
MLIKIALILGFSGLAILLLPRLTTQLLAAARTQTVEDTSSQRVAIIFGAGLWRDGSPTPVLRDRVTTGAELYFAGKVEKLLMSGDNRFDDYNEPAVMRNYAIDLGVPEDAIVLDYAGRRTYDTCYRARDIFELDSAILVTQGFHLPRALYTCNALGVSAVGVSADQRTYRRGSLMFWHTRETIATLVALLEVHLLHPLPVLGEPEPIFTETTKDTKTITAETQSTQRNN